jgi:hypothetical protein
MLTPPVIFFFFQIHFGALGYRTLVRSTLSKLCDIQFLLSPCQIFALETIDSLVQWSASLLVARTRGLLWGLAGVAVTVSYGGA